MADLRSTSTRRLLRSAILALMLTLGIADTGLANTVLVGPEDTSGPGNTVVDIAIPASYYDQHQEHLLTDSFLGEFLPVRRENDGSTAKAAYDGKCLNVSCAPVPQCAEYRSVTGECCARCARTLRKWRTCRTCAPVEGCLKYRQAGRGECCAICIKRKNRIPNGACGTALCPPHRVCRLDKGKAVCVCKQNCPRAHNPVCGTNGVTYFNQCHRKRAECASGTSIGILKRNIC